VQCRSWEESETHHSAQYARLDQFADRLRLLEKRLDTLGTPWYRRVLFRLNGWPAWYIVADRPAWRPWHRWTHRMSNR